MRKILVLLALLILNAGWVVSPGSSVTSADTPFVVASIETTAILQSDTLSLLYGESRLGSATNYVSFDSSGRVSFNNVAVNDVIGLKNNDKISWLTSSGTDIKYIYVSTNDVFVVAGDMEVTGSFTPSLIDSTEISADIVQVDTRLATSGDVIMAYASVDNITAQNVTLVSGDYTEAKVTHLIATDATTTNLNSLNSTIHGASADNVTTTGFTGNDVDVLRLTVTSGVSADNVTTTGSTITDLSGTNATITSLNSTGVTVTGNISVSDGGSIGATSVDSLIVNSVTSFNSTAVFIGRVKMQDLNTGTNAGTALAVDSMGRLCRTGQCS